MRVSATAVLIGLTATFAAESRANPGDSTEDADSLSFYRALVEEVDIRRRVNVLFPNPQSLFDGLQVGFVNVGTGNLTFVRRDMVVPAGGPLVFGRVYDSRILENADFGTGWRLSLAEELRFDAAGLTHVDASGTSRRFRLTGDRYTSARPVPELAGVFVSRDGDRATLHDGHGRRRVFEKQAGTSSMMIVSAETKGAKVIGFSYVNGLLSSVGYEGERVFEIRRDGTGRVVSVSDGHGRSVAYDYTADGLLEVVHDVAGNSWRHVYGTDRRLTEAVGANGEPFLLVDYDESGRVEESRSGREYSFDYEGRKTTVTEGTGYRHTFEQSHTGATRSFASTTGISWRLEFDGENRVRSVAHQGGRHALDYDADGSIASTTGTGGTPDVAEYSYDDSGRLTTVLSGDEWLDVTYVRNKTFIRGLGLDFEFELSGGRVVSVMDQGVHVDVERDEMGYVVGFRGRVSSVRFERDGLRRLAETVYRDGLSSRYSYDALGNRRLAEHSLGSSVAYRHDPAGNIVEVEVANADGSSRLQKTRVGEMNQVEQVVYGDGRTVTVTYDGMGRPTEFDVGSDTVEVSYDELGGLENLVSTTTGDRWVASHSEPPARGSDHRAEVLKGLASIRSQAGHVVLDFDETTFKPVFADPLELGVPGLAEARALLAVASPLLGGDGFTSTSDFEKPSNPVFQPDEYRSTNCCIPCSMSLLSHKLSHANAS